MLGKFIRQEIRAQGKVMLLILGAMAAAEIFMMILMLFERHVTGKIIGSIYAAGCGIYVLTITLSAVIVFVYLCYRFHQSMYSQQGYLTHTLPLKTTQILHVKIFVSSVSLLVIAGFSLASFLGIGIVSDMLYMNRAAALFTEAFQLIDEWGISALELVLGVMLLAVAGCVSSLLVFFAGSSIGQLFHRSKGAWGIAAGIVLAYISEIVTVLLFVWIFFAFGAKLNDMVMPWWFMGGITLVMFLWSAVYYLICRTIVLGHLNLD